MAKRKDAVMPVQGKGRKRYDKRSDNGENHAASGEFYDSARPRQSVSADLQCSGQHHCRAFCGKGSARGGRDL